MKYLLTVILISIIVLLLLPEDYYRIKYKLTDSILSLNYSYVGKPSDSIIHIDSNFVIQDDTTIVFDPHFEDIETEQIDYFGLYAEIRDGKIRYIGKYKP